MAYYFGQGSKKPLNVIEGPMYPDIKKQGPRFVDAGKHWQVDVGATLRDTEHVDQFLGNAVLFQSRDYNQTIYGQSSHRDVVNKNFRPPLLTQEDVLPLSRLPRLLVVPRINPGTADTSLKGYTAQNDRPSGISGHLSDRVKTGDARPTFFCPLSMPEDNAILPDLAAVLPEYSASAGMNTPVTIDAPMQTPVLAHEQFTVLIDAGAQIPVNIDGTVVRPHDFPFNRAQTGANAGMNTPAALDMESAQTRLELFRSLPAYGANAGMNTPAALNMESVKTRLELPRNMPAYAANAGMNTPVTFDAESALTHLDLERGLPEYAVDAGVNTPLYVNSADPRETQLALQPHLDSKFATNPSTSTYDGQNYTAPKREQLDKVRFTLPQVSYVVPSRTSVTSENYRTLPPVMRETLQPDATGYVTGGPIARKGLDIPKVSLRPVGNKLALAQSAGHGLTV